jgi:hypothetical protein
LDLRVTGVSTPTASVNFITFHGAGVGTLGELEGNGLGGVVLSSASNDFAEYLPLVNPAERPQPGEIVGLVAGRLSRRTASAERVFVISTAPIIAGNKPGHGQTDDLGLVTLLGQARVLVLGPAEVGDMIVPSGENDGRGRAVSPSSITLAETRQIVGEVLEGATGQGEHSITILVGQPRDALWAGLLSAQEAQLASITARLSALEGSDNGPGPLSALPWLLAAGGALFGGGVWLGTRARPRSVASGQVESGGAGPGGPA